MEANSLERLPRDIATHILPQALQAPDHLQLPVWEMLQEAEADETHDVPPVVVTPVRDLFLQDGANRNHGGECIAENEELQKEVAAEYPESSSRDHGDVADEFEDRRAQLEDPLVRKGDRTHAAVLSREQHVAVGPQDVKQTFLPAGSLTGQGTQVGGNFGPTGRIGNKADLIVRLLLAQVTVKANHQVEVFTDRAGAESAHTLYQIAAKDAECSGND